MSLSGPTTSIPLEESTESTESPQLQPPVFAVTAFACSSFVVVLGSSGHGDPFSRLIWCYEVHPRDSGTQDCLPFHDQVIFRGMEEAPP